ncbi:MAG: protease modulator HflK, partial [Verrucomicrobiota bacterium]
TEPGAWARNVAGALDYQFGFKVSDTWLFHFLETALLPLVIFQLVVLYLLSCLVFLAPDEAGILEHFGKPVAQLASGAHLKLPWPFEMVRRFPVNHILSFRLGQGQAGQVEPSVIVWSIPHIQGEEQFLVAAPRSGTDTNTVPVNLVSFNILVEYQITNIFAFAYNHADAARLVEQIAYRSLTQEAAARDLLDLLGAGQTRITDSLRQRVQSETDRRQLGIAIKFVGLQSVHPPTQVAEAFESVIGALEQKEANILAAHAAAGRTVTLAAANSAKALLAATGYRVQRTEVSTAEAQRFLILAQTASKSPRVFRTNLYLGVIAEALADTRKYIVPASAANEVIQINFEEKLRPELFDLGTEKKEK